MAPGSLDEFAEFCALLKLEDGTPFELHDFQRRMLGDYFDGATETLILVSKKNGKTTLLAALALHHLMTTPDAECVIAAASRDQAQILLNQARGFVRRSGLGKYLTVKQREIVSLRDEGRCRVMASDSDTADGVIPTLAVVDELHRHKDRGAMYGVFRDGLGPRKGRMLTISTAGDDVDSPLGLMREAAYELPTVERDGAYRYARADSGDYVMHEWALDPGDDRADMDVVKGANPAPWQTVEALRRRFDSPSTTPWQWARFACGVWLTGETSWLEAEQWSACRDDAAQIPDGADVWVGVDLGVRHDTTAIVTCWKRPDDGRWVCKAKVLVPPGGDRALPLALVEDEIRALRDRYRLLAVAFDPWSLRRSAEMLTGEGIPMVEHPMSAERMAVASALLYRLIEERQVAHDGDQTFRSHVLAASTKQTERGWRLVKDTKARKPIDACIALAIALSTATVVGQASPYERKDLLILQ